MPEWKYFYNCLIAVFFGFILRFIKERKKENRVNIFAQAAVSLGVSYIAYLIYRDRGFGFCSIELWLTCASYYSSLILSVSDQLFNNAWRVALTSFTKWLTAYTDKEFKPEKNDSE